jgi:hypothetical protein
MTSPSSTNGSFAGHPSMLSLNIVAVGEGVSTISTGAGVSTTTISVGDCVLTFAVGGILSTGGMVLSPTIGALVGTKVGK